MIFSIFATKLLAIRIRKDIRSDHDTVYADIFNWYKFNIEIDLAAIYRARDEIGEQWFYEGGALTIKEAELLVKDSLEFYVIMLEGILELSDKEKLKKTRALSNNEI